MSNQSTTGLLITAAFSFLGGMAVGLLLSPRSGRENRLWLSDNAGIMGHWIDTKSKHIIHLTEEQMAQLAAHIRESLDANIPDLYKATEHISIKDKPENGNTKKQT